MDDFNFNITIVGLGLIGGSFAMALRQLKPKNIWAIDINKEALSTAEKMGVIDKGYIGPEFPLKDTDITILCLYPNLLVDFITKYKDQFKPGSMITDTVGVKGDTINQINEILPDNVEFIGGHPMAGKETSGFSSASAILFKNCNYILTPSEKNKKESIDLIKTIIIGIGCGKIIQVTAGKHDEMIAYTSQLPHVIASALMQNLNLNEAACFVGGSFRDATRVAEINDELWPQLLLQNKTNLLKQMDIFEENMRKIKTSIENNDSIELKSLFKDVKSKRAELK